MEITVASPFPFAALPRVWSWASTFRDKISDDFGPKDLTSFMAAMGAKLEAPGYQTWSVSVDGELVGLVAMERLSPWIGSAHWILKPDFHGKGVMLKASMVAVGEMFQAGIGKLSFYPLAGNWAMFSLLAKLGAKKEGVLRAQTLSDGKPVDMHLYGLLKEEFIHAVNTGTHRSGSVDPGLDLRQQAEAADVQLHHHADADAGASIDHVATAELPAERHDQSDGGPRSCENGGPGERQPELCRSA